MGDSIYRRVQYPLKKAIDLIKDFENKDLELLVTKLEEKDKEKIKKFIDFWENKGKSQISSLTNYLRNND